MLDTPPSVPQDEAPTTFKRSQELLITHISTFQETTLMEGLVLSDENIVLFKIIQQLMIHIQTVTQDLQSKIELSATTYRPSVDTSQAEFEGIISNMRGGTFIHINPTIHTKELPRVLN